MCKKLVFCVLFVFSLATGKDAATAQGVTEVLAFLGDTLPGETATILDLNSGKLNENGQVAFSALVTGGKGVFRAESGMPLVSIVRVGDATANGVFSNFTYSDINNAGQVAFVGDLTGTSGGSSDDRGYYVGSGGPLTEAAREGQRLNLSQPLAGINNARFADFDILPIGEGPTLTDSGRLAFVGHISGCMPIINGCTPVKYEAVFSSYSGNQKILAQENKAAPVAGGGTLGTFDDFTGPAPWVIPTAAINNLGHVVYRATSDRPTDQGLYFTKSSHFSTTQLAIVRTGQSSLPGLSSRKQIRALGGEIDLNDSGQVVFEATLEQASTGNPAEKAIYRWSYTEALQPGADGLTEIVHSGQAIPGINDTIGVPGTFKIQMNEGGEVSFISSIDSGTGFGDKGVFRGDGQDLDLIARFDQPTPDGLLSYKNFLGTAINDLGQVAFEADLQDSFGRFVGDGLYIGDGDNLIEVVRSGQPLAGSTVDRLYFREEDGINSSGQVSYSATLVDGREGLFLFTPPSLTALPGDIDGDGTVDGSDFLQWQRGGQTVLQAPSLSDWEDNYGTSASQNIAAAAAVPEPATMLLAMLGMVSTVCCRRRPAQYRP